MILGDSKLDKGSIRVKNIATLNSGVLFLLYFIYEDNIIDVLFFFKVSCVDHVYIEYTINRQEQMES